MYVIPSFRLGPDTDRPAAALLAQGVEYLERDGFHRFDVTPGRRGTAFDPRPLEEAMRELHCEVQVGARSESESELGEILSLGASHVVLGPRALDEPGWTESVAARYPGHLVVATPARERRTRTRGAVRSLPLDLREIAESLRNLPLSALLVEFDADTDIGFAELALLEDLAEELAFPLFVGGYTPSLSLLRDFEFRGVTGALIDATTLVESFDASHLARSFGD